jgi:predicted phage terminase large subunit-like protein
MWPAWEWTRNPEQRWMFASYAASVAYRDSLKCRDVITSEWYRNFWGPESGHASAYDLRDDQNSASRYVNTRTGVRLATTCGGFGTGHGGNRIVVDDPHHTLRVESQTDRAARIGWWQKVMSSRSDDATATRVIIMQRSHEEDLTGFLLAQEGGYEHLRLPARYEADYPCHTVLGDVDPRREEGQLLCPERFGEDEVRRLEHALGSYASAAQLQQRPSPRRGGIFDEAWWQYYTVPPPLSELDFMLMSWDMAFKDLSTSSYVCGQVWGFKGADSYLYDQVRDRMDFVKTCRAVVRLCNKWPSVRRKYIEGKANGPAVISTLKSRVKGLLEFNPNEYGSKVARAYAISPEVESGNVHLPQNAPWVAAYMEEMGMFPNGRYNDQVDTTSQALLAADKMRKRVPTDLPPLIVDTQRSAVMGRIGSGSL